ncbi:MAG TPA: DUF1707 domain-containing protein [Streptosporangiaceae bacterium]|nr:DUF1707 domain-containing protein [Streptosporangiaceae bacterium]
MAGQPRTPAGDADRERIISLLREQFAQGRIDEAELDRRVSVVLAAVFVDEAAGAVADLPELVVPGSVGRSPRRHGHGQASRPEPGWVPTSERFRDPTSGVVMRVWLDPAAKPGAERRYVPDG